MFGSEYNWLINLTYNASGARMALGAQPRDVVFLIVSLGVKLTLIGSVLGLGGAWLVARVLTAIAPQLGSNDFQSVIMATVILMIVALLACYFPARRATQVDPVVALRSE